MVENIFANSVISLCLKKFFYRQFRMTFSSGHKLRRRSMMCFCSVLAPPHFERSEKPQTIRKYYRHSERSVSGVRNLEQNSISVIQTLTKNLEFVKMEESLKGIAPQTFF